MLTTPPLSAPAIELIERHRPTVVALAGGYLPDGTPLPAPDTARSRWTMQVLPAVWALALPILLVTVLVLLLAALIFDRDSLVALSL